VKVRFTIDPKLLERKSGRKKVRVTSMCTNGQDDKLIMSVSRDRVAMAEKEIRLIYI
jgi:hypothetical protein